MVSVVAAVTVPGFFDNASREATLLAGILLLIWLPSIPVPKFLRRLMMVLASASLYAYLVHWLVYPPLAGISPALAVAGSLAAGVAYWALCMRVVSASSRRRARLAGRPAGRSSRARSRHQARFLPRKLRTSGRTEHQ